MAYFNDPAFTEDLACEWLESVEKKSAGGLVYYGDVACENMANFTINDVHLCHKHASIQLMELRVGESKLTRLNMRYNMPMSRKNNE